METPLTSLLDAVPLPEVPPHSSVAWYQWARTSPDMLEYYERAMLQGLQVPYTVSQTLIDDDTIINTLETHGRHTEVETPVLLVHGFGGGIGLFVKNIDAIAAHRKLYAIDVLGFGRSSRPDFCKSDGQRAENALVEAIEAWRKAKNINKFILVGHSFGGYQVGAYTQRYPERVAHVVFADPWGFPEHPTEDQVQSKPLWLRAAIKVATGISPFAILRGLGPLGPKLIPRLRPDLPAKFDTHIARPEIVTSYIYHLNAQKPSGEHAFLAMSQMLGWAKIPFISRIASIDKRVPMTFIYGRHTWMDRGMGHAAKQLRPESDVHVSFVPGAGHHVYADNADAFNEEVIRVVRATK